MNTHFLRILLACLILACGQGEHPTLDEFVEKRPAHTHAIADHVGLLEDVRESIEHSLAGIKDRYGIEILMVALPSLENRYTVNEAAAELFTNWGIGKANHGRGILLLFVDDEKKVKLEVGLIAVMEALESRAQIKFGGNYTPASIAAIDLDYLSQGAGAGRRLNRWLEKG